MTQQPDDLVEQELQETVQLFATFPLPICLAEWSKHSNRILSAAATITALRQRVAELEAKIGGMTHDAS